MLQRGAGALTSLYAELSQQLKHAVCPPFRIFSGSPSKITPPAPLPSREYIDLTVVFCAAVNWGSAQREREREKVCRTRGNFTGRSYFVHPPQTVRAGSQVFQAVRCRHGTGKFASACVFGTARRFLIKANAKYPEIG